MPAATLTFSAPLNASCQVGDIVYYVSTMSTGGFTTNTNNVIDIGEIREIQGATSNTPVIIADTDLGYEELNGLTDKFILFSKNNKANLSSPLGYYASVKLINDDTREAGELFSVAAEVFESSK
jgi:hypothetical protein